MTVTRHGYHLSVYRRIACLTLEEKSVAYKTIEIDPFITPVPDAYLALHPYGLFRCHTRGMHDAGSLPRLAGLVDWHGRSPDNDRD
jgi:hypothetical protein